MKKVLTTTFLSFTLLTHSGFAGTTPTSLMILGGGGEPKGHDTIFDNSLNQLAEYTQKADLKQMSITFNGGHEETEKIIGRNFPTAQNLGNFTEDHYNKIIEDYTQKINSKNIKDGEQVLVYINTHGAQIKNGQVTHNISTTTGGAIKNYTTGEGTDMVSMDKLIELKKAAEENGVKLAIVDLSCHSGAALNLAGDKTCVISSTGPKHLAYASPTAFGDQFTALLEKGKNLEEVFLKARDVADDNGVPMISTPANFEITRNLYSAITPYLHESNRDGDKLGNYLIHTVDNMCVAKREDDFKQIMSLIDQVEKVNSIEKRFLFWKYSEKTLDLTNLKNDLIEYKSIQDKMIKELSGLNTKLLSEKMIVPYEGLMDTVLTAGELLRTDYEAMIEHKQKEILQDGDNEETNPQLQVDLSWLKHMQATQKRVSEANPGLARAATMARQFHLNVRNTYYLANRIKENEKKLYSSLYKHYQKAQPEKSNPCRDFVL